MFSAEICSSCTFKNDTVTYVRFHGINPSRTKVKEIYADLKHKENTEVGKEIYSVELHSNKKAFIRSQTVESVHRNVTWSKCYENTLTSIRDCHPHSSTVQGLERHRVHILYPKCTEAMRKQQPANTTGSWCQHAKQWYQECQPELGSQHQYFIFWITQPELFSERAALTANRHFSSEVVTKAQHAQTSQKGSVSPGAKEEIPGRASVKSFLRTEAVGSGTICLQYYTYLWYNYTTFNYSSHWTNKSLWTKSLWKASIFPYVTLIYFTCKTNLAKHANWKSYFSGIPWKIK